MHITRGTKGHQDLGYIEMSALMCTFIYKWSLVSEIVGTWSKKYIKIKILLLSNENSEMNLMIAGSISGLGNFFPPIFSYFTPLKRFFKVLYRLYGKNSIGLKVFFNFKYEMQSALGCTKNSTYNIHTVKS